MKTIATATIDGQHTVTWAQQGTKHSVVYGDDVETFYDAAEAFEEFINCIKHARECASDTLEAGSLDYKTVSYFGMLLEVPKWANFIACDADGEIYAYEFEPELSIDCWCCGSDRLERLAEAESDRPTLEESLVEL